MAKIALSSVTFRYPQSEQPQLSDFTVQIPSGTCTALVGPSGCAKTTVLRLIAGLETPQSGTITIGDQVVSGPGVWVPPQRRQLGLVFQDYALFPHFTVAKNVSYGLFSLPRADRTRRVKEVLELVDMVDFARRYPWQLSGGQQQRVALARALAPHPQALLLDEPFSHLDAELRVSVRREVAQLLQQASVTSVLVTHDLDDASALADNTVVMSASAPQL